MGFQLTLLYDKGAMIKHAALACKMNQYTTQLTLCLEVSKYVCRCIVIVVVVVVVAVVMSPNKVDEICLLEQDFAKSCYI